MSELVITLDVDWAPDFIIDDVASILIEANVRATWFVTHSSPAVSRLNARSDLFELGIHPNFLPGSTHGNSTREVLTFCMMLQPGAVSMRTHGLVQSTRILSDVLELTDIRTDVSLFLPHCTRTSPLNYWWRGKRLTRIPFIWEDDVEGMRPEPLWQAQTFFHGDGPLSVLNFHPLLLHLNDGSLSSYETLKRRQSDMQSITPEHTRDLRSEGDGPLTMFLSAVEHLAGTSRGRTIAEVAASD